MSWSDIWANRSRVRLAVAQPGDAALVHAEVVADLVPHRALDLFPRRVRLAEDHDSLEPSARVVDAHQAGGMAVLNDHRDALQPTGHLWRQRVERLLHGLPGFLLGQTGHGSEARASL